MRPCAVRRLYAAALSCKCLTEPHRKRPTNIRCLTSVLQAFRAFESSRMQRVRTILSDAAPPFAVRTPLILSASFAPLWSPADLPVPVASVEEGMAWSRGVVREVVERQMFVQRQQL